MNDLSAVNSFFLHNVEDGFFPDKGENDFFAESTVCGQTFFEELVVQEASSVRAESALSKTKTPLQWTQEETDQLREIMMDQRRAIEERLATQIRWKKIFEQFPHHEPSKVREFGYRLLSKLPNVRPPKKNERSVSKEWSDLEDSRLLGLVNEYIVLKRPIRWTRVAKELEPKTLSQCTHRWFQVLSPTRINADWTPTEDAKIQEFAQKFKGSKIPWQSFCPLFPGRSPKDLAAHWLRLK